jgi:8-oxo-dGTP diphosphatase
MTPELDTFTAYFNTLSIEERMRLTAHFLSVTGGRLSPFNSPVPVAAALIPIATPNGMALLGGVRGIQPGFGAIGFPGGYLEPMENGPVAVAREVFEETSLQTNPEDYELITTDIAKSNTLLLIYLCRKVYSIDCLTTLPVSREVLAHIPVFRDTQLAFTLHAKARDWYFSKFF